jgi:Cu-processing system permease protein
MILLYLSNDVSKAIVSLMNITFILTPLIGTIFGILNFYNSREFIELILGMGLPFVIYGIAFTGQIRSLLILLMCGIFLTFIFTGLSFYIALINENRLKGFGMAILFWLFMVFIYDGVFLVLLLFLQSYPIEKLAIFLSLLNPVDLSRILIMLELDISALMGYTGAVFNKFFGTTAGMLISISALFVWTLTPVFLIIKKSSKKDF